MKNVVFSLFVCFFVTQVASSQISEGVYIIRSAVGNRVLDVQWGNPNAGTPMHLWDYNGGAAQIWHVKRSPDGFYTIQSDLGRYLDVSNASNAPGTIVHLWDYNGSVAQQWHFSAAGDGSFFIKSSVETYLDVQNSNSAAGTPIWMYPYNGSTAQRWYLEPFIKRRVLTEIKHIGDPKNLAVILAEIWMGECGNANNCHHEPVAGLVTCELINTQSAESIPVNVGHNNQIWRAYDHTLVCDNYHAPREFDNGEGIGRQRLGVLQFPIEEALLNSDVYHLKARFNLGVRHQDNPLASVGGHWLAKGDNLVEALIPMNAGTLRQGAIIGPFHTVSDRCHEFWLKFTFGVWDRD
ncbi:MAG TPA: RICIN domain-containing protein [Saprospiraceae bacterium]|nr:RICIN domain-containing protein [Saprospiraceae bacterium]